MIIQCRVDQYPYREDGRNAVNESIQWMIALNAVMSRMDDAEVKSVVKNGDAVEISRMLRKYMFQM